MRTINNGAGPRRLLAATAAVVTLGLTVTACSSDPDDGNTSPDATSDSSAEPADTSTLDQALEEGGELTYWAWAPGSEEQVAAFNATYPNASVELANVGTNTDQYTQMQNAIAAGSGGPDVAQVEYYAIPQFALTGDLVDLTQYGFDDLESDYSSGPWTSVAFDGGIWGLPQDSGPMVMLYNQTLFDEHGIEVPETWDEYIAAGEALSEADSNVSIVADQGDSGLATSLIWQAGGQPFNSDGTNVTVNLEDEGSMRYAQMWDQLVENDSVAPISPWSDEWYRGLGEGTIATLLMGAWMPGILESSVPDGAGDWRVAPLPTYDGTPVSAENGGSGQVVLEQSENPELAAAFVRWLNNDPESIELFLDNGGFPSTTANLESEDFLNEAPEYFSGQEVNQVLAEAATTVPSGWQYLPYHVYAISVFPDTVGQVYNEDISVPDGLLAWQEQLVEFGRQQGFTVNP